MFAARALKSALFGTPAPPVEEVTLAINTETEAIPDKDMRNARSYGMSPTKPPGILLTPGTATTRRKTVSFGTEIPDKNEKTAEGQAEAKSEQTTSAEKERPRPANTVSRKTSLTKSLELARDTKPGRHNFEIKRASSRLQPLIDLDQDTNGIEEVAASQSTTAVSSKLQMSNQNLLLQLVPGAEVDGDMTMDLNEPYSQSGKYWKSEYDQYHDEAKAEMEKLLKYKQLAKSYAKKKDAETLVLTGKLKDEQCRALSLEDRISKLSAKVNTTDIEGNSDGRQELAKELAKQTALARQYKAQAEDLLAVREENADDPSSLRQEMRDLREALSAEKKTGSKLQEENKRLTQELLDANMRLEEQENRSERRRRATEEQLQKKTEAYKSLQRDYDSLKEKAKAQRGNAEHLLRKNHDQIVALRKELASARRAELVVKDTQQPQKKLLEGQLVVTGRQKQRIQVAEELEEASEERTNAVEARPIDSRKKFDSETKYHYSPNVSKAQDNHIPSSSQSISGVSKSPTYLKQSIKEPVSRSLAMQAPPTALSEIAYNANTDRRSSKGTTPLGRTPPSSQMSNIPRGTPSMDLPSPEPPLSHLADRMAPSKNSKPSPRPSMFTFSVSPPKPDVARPRALDKLPSQRSDGTHGGEQDVHAAPTRRLSLEASRTTRTALPPERAAAARARLEKKNAEKKRAQALGWEQENIRN